MAAVPSHAFLGAQLDSENLLDVLVSELAQFRDYFSWPLSLAPLAERKTCTDATIKVVVSPQSGKPAAMFICSPASAPELISRSAALAESVRGVVGDDLGEAIVRPIATGYLHGRSYILLPYLPGFSSSRAARLAQRLLIRRPLLDWLQQANAAAAARHGSDAETTARFLSVLRHLRNQQLFSGSIQAAIEHAMARLETKQWIPRHAFDHNDLWLGNVMLAPRSAGRAAHRFPFVLIDWPGANPRGYGIYDLLRIAPDLKLSPAALRAELVRHSVALHCELEDTRGHLLAALGRLHLHLENFPRYRFIGQVQESWALLDGALRC